MSTRPENTDNKHCCGSDKGIAATEVGNGSGVDTKTETDLVCGMMVDPNIGKPALKHLDKTYHFCSTGCHDKFEADPEFYITGAHKRKVVAVVAGAQYTCPMHPDIIEDELIDCPLCGMALEPMGVPTDAPNLELIDFTRRFIVSVIFAIPLLFLTMGPMVGINIRDWLGEKNAIWAELFLAAPVVVWAAFPFFKRGWGSILNRSPNMWTLIMLGVSAAFSYSLFAAIMPEAFPASLVRADGTVAVYFEASAVIVALVFLGQILELRARERTGSAIRSLLNLAPKLARRINADGSERDVPVENILVGDLLRIRPGESVPVDGIIIEGRSSIDESMISGEPIAVEKNDGDLVTGGTLNGTGSLIMKAERVGADMMLAKIVEMVATAQRSRAPIQSIADKVAGYFVPLVVLTAIIAFFAWYFFGPAPSLLYGLISAVSVLIIACPCALGLATPMSIMIATGRGAQAGVLIRDAEALERFADVDVLLVDKTGTLTEGRPALSDILPTAGFAADDILQLAASVEVGSEHPLADAIYQGARDRKLEPCKTDEFEAVTGMGVSGLVSGRHVALGNQRMMERVGVAATEYDLPIAALRDAGKSALFIAIDKELAGVIAVMDPIKPSSSEAVLKLKKLGLKVIMATGDSERTAKAVGQKLGIDEIHAGILPAEKKALVDELHRNGFRVAMAGDGVNDAPALAAADVGIAMGTGADVAVESAGFTLVKGDLNGIVRARELSTATIRNIKQNLFFAFLYNVAGVPIAAGILYPLTGMLLSPMLAAAAMSFSSVSVIGNALRLRSIKL